MKTKFLSTNLGALASRRRDRETRRRDGGAPRFTGTMRAPVRGNLTRLLANSILAFTLAALTAAAGPETTMPKSPIHEPLRWISTGPLIKPVSDEHHHLVSIKDPTIVRYEGKWLIYATVANTAGQWNMVYLSFKNWSEAGTAKQIYLDTANPNLRGYHCAPQLFYFRPQKKWYLIYQSQPPTYSTTDDPSKPETWSKPRFFYSSEPAGVPKLWIDYWVICDSKNAYLFSSGDDGRWYRCQTKLKDFPKGFGAPVVVMQDTNRFGLFEASCVYKLRGTRQYLAFIEAIGKDGNRYFKGFLSDSLDGKWRPFHDTESDPFAGLANVKSEDGGKLWTRDISHGELLRDGYDQTLTIDPKHLEFLYQGLPVATPRDMKYSQLPYQLGLLRQDMSTK